MKKRNPVAVFICYLLAVSGIIVGIFSAVAQWNPWVMAEDYKNTGAYRQAMGALLYQACGLAVGSDASGWQAQGAEVSLDNERTNIVWYIQGNGETVKNGTSAQTLDEFLAEVHARSSLGGKYFGWMDAASQGEYSHLIVLDQNGIYEEKSTRLGEAQSQTTLARSDYAAELTPHLSQLLALAQDNNVKICLAVRSEQHLDNTGSIYTIYYNWFRSMTTIVWLAALVAVCLILWLITLFLFRTMRLAREGLARFTGHIWLEIKLVLTVLAVYVGANMIIGGMMLDSTFFVLFLPCFWWCWLVLNDLRYNKKAFWKNNIVTSVVHAFRSLESRHTYLECRKQRAALMLCVETVLLALMLGAVLFADSLPIPAWVICGGFAFITFAVLVGYTVATIRGFDDWGRIIDYAHEIRTGTAAQRLTMPEKSVLTGVAEDLSCIHSGISSAVDERVRSEKMKAELVTNVSHDLKTPLTSIINYVDLLDKENLSPSYTNEYVDILAQKSQRLKNLVQDLFEVSKANSGAMEICPERIDVAALIEQTIAEMDARTESAGIEVKTQFDTPRIYTTADGRQMHRVFENLLGNALKYSLTGTRVYITAREVAGGAEISFKNVAGYEMDFTAKDIVERFQRGDASRATEGSGLGLAIAKSFVELNHGMLQIEIDGDLFKVSVYLPATMPAQAPASTPMPAPAPEATPVVAPAPETVPETPVQAAAAEPVAAFEPAPEAEPVVTPAPETVPETLMHTAAAEPVAAFEPAPEATPVAAPAPETVPETPVQTAEAEPVADDSQKTKISPDGGSETTAFVLVSADAPQADRAPESTFSLHEVLTADAEPAANGDAAEKREEAGANV